MPDNPRKQRRELDLETNTAPDLLRDDLRRRDQRRTPPDSLPPRDESHTGEEPAGGGYTPTPDGGNSQHPIHDDDEEDATPNTYEREIARLDTAAFERIGRN